MSNYVRSVRALGAELRQMVEPRAEAAYADAITAVVAGPPQPIAVVGVHGISPIQQYAFQDQLATGLLAYLNARDDLRLGAAGRQVLDELFLVGSDMRHRRHLRGTSPPGPSWSSGTPTGC